MTRKIVFNAAVIAAVAFVYLLASGKGVRPERLIVAVLLVPVMAYMIWLRRDWAGRAARAERERNKLRDNP